MKQLFQSPLGEVDAVNIRTDRVNGEIARFRFVTFTTAWMHGCEVEGRELTVRKALQRGEWRPINLKQESTCIVKGLFVEELL